MRERMGSGGPRGLQILRSGASRVRGGFDSHAFPPLLVLPLAVLLACAAPGRAAAQSPVAADSATRSLPPAAAPDTAGRAAARRPSWTAQPRVVMLRSLLVPGWGQVYNHAWLKAAAVAGGEGWLIGAILHDQRVLSDLQDEVRAAQASVDEVRYADAVNRYNARLETFVGRQWLLGGVLAYALVDAYVDAHFRNFDLEFRHDPALPDDLPADPGAPKRGGAARTAGTRVALRWHF